MGIKGTVRLDRRTKNLIQRLHPKEIAVICHAGIDEVAATALVSRRVKAVINTGSSVSEIYPNDGPLILLQAGIPIIDQTGEELFNLVADGEKIEIKGSEISVAGNKVAEGKLLSVSMVEEQNAKLKINLERQIEKFVNNTLDHARNELALLLNEITVPATKTVFKQRHVLIVIRGRGYKEDLAAIRQYIHDLRPILVGVDGGADALIEYGYRPDVIIGDMDSVSDQALSCGAEIIVHAYTDGYSPGLNRIDQLGLSAIIFPSPGTSEDIALLLAYEKGADLIVAVGTHSCMIDFLEKGRAGMASTFLVRQKIGSLLVDARGVSKLYRRSIRTAEFVQIAVASLASLFIVIMVSPFTRPVFRLIALKLRLVLNI